MSIARSGRGLNALPALITLHLLAIWRLALIRLSLAVAGYQRTLRWANRLHQRAGHCDPQASIRAIGRSARLMPGCTCLHRAMVLLTLLPTSAGQATLQFGVRKLDDTLVGHAWIDLDGKPLVVGTSPHETHALLQRPGEEG